ncbi:MAG: putative porin [Spongiibacteraceae bacterium]
MKKRKSIALINGAASTVVAASIIIFGGASHAVADDVVDTSAVTAQDLLKLLVEEGVIDKDKLKGLAEKIKNRQTAQPPQSVQPVRGAVETVNAENKDKKPASDGSVVRVPYVPQYIKDEIRDQVRLGLKDDVSRDVMAQAKQERWGLPGALPEWVNTIKFSGDMRVREESTFYAADNFDRSYYDFASLNKQGKFTGTDKDYLNTTEDRHRLRSRFRFNVKAKINNWVDVGARLVTGNITDPVSTNQTLGSYGQKWQTNFDLAYLKFATMDKQYMLSAGRIENPFFGSDLIWDADLTFEGVAASWWFLRNDHMDDDFRSINPFITVGAFPISEVDRSSDDKWLYAAQTGFQYEFRSQSKLTAALAYYAYENIVGKWNTTQDDTTFDYTAPTYMQRGNTLFNIRNNSDSSSLNRLWANAVDYRLANAYVEYDIASFSPIHIIAVADYVKNLGFDKDEVARRVGTVVEEQSEGYQARVTIGWPQVTKARDWQVSFIYRYVERDAVLDAFTDSDFHGGGTDAEGYIIKFDYGLLDNVWATLRWLSSNEIDANSFLATGYGTGKFGVDTLQLDLNAKF